MPEAYSAPKVLLSYSHDSPEHMARVLALSDRLRAEGVDSQLDQYETSPPEGWPRWTLNQIEWADFVLVVCTATYDRRFRGREEAGRGRGVTWEGAILTQDLYDAAAHNTKFIPITFSEEETAHIPLMLRGATFYTVSTEEGYEALYRRLTNQPRTQKPGLGRQRPLPPRPHHAPGGATIWPVEAPRPGHTEAAEEEDGATSPARPAFNRKVLYALLAAALILGVGYWRIVHVPRNEPVQYGARVIDAKTGRPVRAAKVSVVADGFLQTCYTDSEGVMSVKLSPEASTAHIRVDAVGFEPFERNERLSPDGFLEFRLTEAAPVSTPTPTPMPTATPTPAPTRRPTIPRPTTGRRTPCTPERIVQGLC